MEILNNQEKIEKPKLSNETIILNELIREYLTWNGYEYTKSIFVQGIKHIIYKKLKSRQEF